MIDLLHWSFFAKLSLLNLAQSRCCKGLIFSLAGPSMAK